MRPPRGRVRRSTTRRSSGGPPAGHAGAGREAGAGAFPYLVDIGLVRGAREILDAAAAGAGQPDRPDLVVLQPAILGGGPAVRDAARGLVRRYLGQPNYRANLRRGGYTEEDLDAVSDPLVDALVATGDAAALRARVTSLGEAGADHVAVIPLSAAGREASLETAAAVAPDPREWAGPGVANARPGL
jgi:hypothetical protein